MLFKFSSFDGHIRFISVFPSLPLVRTLNLINPIHIPEPIYVRSTFRVSYNLRLDISGICSLQVFPTKIIYVLFYLLLSSSYTFR